MLKRLSWILIFSFTLSIENAFAVKVSLPPLDCSKDAVIGSNVGIRPYRKGGIRLEKESLGDKAIFHNYGHGGTGVTLAPGCVEKVVSLFNQEDPEHQSVGVLGAGYMGIMTALQLSKEGHHVTVYADQFPRTNYFYEEGNPCITSLVAGGLWLPYGVDQGSDPVLFQSLQKRSFNYYKDVADTAKHPGVSFRDVYSFAFQEGRKLPEELGQTELVEVEFGNHRYTPAHKWSTLFIDGGSFLNDLHTTAMAKGVAFEQKKFSDTDDVLELQETYIFNCTGYGSKSLFDDRALKPIRGQLLYMRPQPAIDFFLSGKGNSESFTVFPSGDKVAIWGTYEEGVDVCETEPAALERIRQNAASFFEGKV